MKLLIICILSIAIGYSHAASYYGYHGPLAPIGHDGRVVDTPEVAHAKAAHFAAFTEAASKASYSVPSYTENVHSSEAHGFSQPIAYSTEMHHHGHGYHGPLAPLDHEGRVVDTPEVAEAKAAHFAAYNHAATHSYDAPFDHGYHGSPLSAHRIAYEIEKHAPSFNHHGSY